MTHGMSERTEHTNPAEAGAARCRKSRTLFNPERSPIRNPQSAIRSPQSEVRNEHLPNQISLGFAPLFAVSLPFFWVDCVTAFSTGFG